jgi:hypothetical protein
MDCLFLVQYKYFLYLSWVNNYKFRASRGTYYIAPGNLTSCSTYI